MKYYALGDSIVELQGTTLEPKNYTGTDLQGNSRNETVRGYIQEIEKRFGLVCTNKGHSGHTLVQDYGELSTLDYSDVALVTIAYGVNDARTGVPLGTLNDTTLSTFAGCLNMLLKKIYTDNPECRIIVLSPLQRLRVTDFGIADQNANGNYLIDFVNMCKSVAEKRSTEFIDMYRCSGLNQTNLYYYTREGVHPLNSGYKRMAALIIDTINKFVSVDFNAFGSMSNTGSAEPDAPESEGNGNSGTDAPVEEPTGTVVEIAHLFTMDGFYYDTWQSVFGKGGYNGTEFSIELLPNRTYTLITYIEKTAVYVGAICNSNDNSTHKGNGLKVTAGSDIVVIDGFECNRATITFSVTETMYLSVGCVKQVDASNVSLTYI